MMRIIIASTLAVVVYGCSPGGGNCEGSVGCVCVDGSRCLTGLVCIDGHCQNLPGADTGGRDGGADLGVRRDAARSDATSGIRDAAPNPDAFFAEDPPPMECREDGTMGPPPELPGGTPECPDDKHREGCRCTTIGERVDCWPGLRAHRGRGICHDGTTECVPFDEFSGVWGPCEGYVLPREDATLGPEACRCFSMGRWEIDNLSPCFISYGGGQVYAVSTILSGDTAACPSVDPTPPPTRPGSDWSTDRLTVDCEGRFELCYTLKAGDADAPTGADCVMAEVCTEAWYEERNVTQELPPLDSWVGTDPACARQFRDTGGYGEMSVLGLSVECDEVDDGTGGRYVFNRVNYCPLSCNTDPPPDTEECRSCMMGGSGSF